MDKRVPERRAEQLKNDPFMNADLPPELLAITDGLMQAGNEEHALALLDDFARRGPIVIDELMATISADEWNRLILPQPWPGQIRLF